MAEKVTIMKLKVDLQCRKCYKKVKKVLCKYPQIRDQLYDEKNDMVTIRVVCCCSPENMRDIICCEGGGSIKSIEIVEPPKPKPPPGKPKESENKPKSQSGPPTEPQPQPPKQDLAPPPPVATPAVVFPDPAPVSVYAYPSPVVPVGLFHGGAPGGFPGYYGRPIYDSYGGSGPCYVGPHHEYLYQEADSGCTIN